MAGRTCRFRGTCVAEAAADSPYCVVHQPEKILARVENVVFNNFAVAMTTAREPARLQKLYDDLLHDLKETV